MIPDPCIEVHTTPLDRPSVPAWFAEVVILACQLAATGLLESFADQVHLRRGRFGTYEPIDFLALLVGYALSGERTLADFFERVEPFETAFMALFGRKGLPHRSSLSRFLSDVDRPCLEAFRTLFEQHFTEGWTSEAIGGICDRQDRRYIVFDVDATRQAARQRALPCDPTLPAARRRLDAVCAPGYKGRKRGEVVRLLLRARKSPWASGWGSGSTNSSSPHWTRTGFWSRMCWISIMDVEHLKRCSLMKMSKKIPIAGAPTRSAERRLWQIACQWVWNLRLTLGKTMQGDELREIEWASPKEAAPLFFAWESTPEEYGPWQLAGDVGRARGQIGSSAFVFQENGRLRCPAGASLWLSEVRQENAFTQRAVYLAYQTDCQCCALREQCLAPGGKGNRARRVSAVRRLLPPPSSVERKPVLLGPMRWVDVAGRALRRRWMAHWRRQYVEVLPLAQSQREAKPPARPPRALRSHHRWNWRDRLARNAWWGPPQVRVTVAGVPAFLAMN